MYMEWIGRNDVMVLREVFFQIEQAMRLYVCL